MKSNRVLFGVVILALSIGVVLGVAHAENTYSLVSSGLTSGGTLRTSGDYILEDAVGQAAWRSTGQDYVLVGGLIASSGTTLNISVVDYPAPKTVTLGQKNVAMLRFNLSVSGSNSVTVSSLTVKRLGGSIDSDIDLVKLYADDGDGAFDPAKDSLLGSQSLANAQATIAGSTKPIQPGTSQVWFVVCDISATAVAKHVVTIGPTQLVQTGADFPPKIPTDVSENPTWTSGDVPIPGETGCTISVGDPKLVDGYSGDTETFNISAQAFGGFTGKVALSIKETLPPGVTSQFTPASLDLPSVASAKLTITTTGGDNPNRTPAMDHILTVIGHDVSGTIADATDRATLRLRDFTIAALQSQTILKGKSISLPVILNSLNGSDSTVNLQVSLLPAVAGQPTITPTSVNLSSTSPASATVTFDTTNAEEGKTYALTVTGSISGGPTHAQVASLTVNGKPSTEVKLKKPFPSPLYAGNKLHIEGTIVDQNQAAVRTENYILTYKVTDPTGADKQANVSGVAKNADGTFAFDLFLDTPGQWKHTVSWSGNVDFKEATSPEERIDAVPDPGYFLIIEGTDVSKPWTKDTLSGDRAGNNIFTACDKLCGLLVNQLQVPSDRIRYLSPRHLTEVITSVRTYGAPSISTVSDSILAWAKERVNKYVPLFIYLADHGIAVPEGTYMKGAMRMGNENLDVTQFASWLKDFPSDVAMTIVYDACFSGTFLESKLPTLLTGTNRVIVTASRADRITYTYPDSLTRPSQGLLFSTLFFNRIGLGESVKSAYDGAELELRKIQPWMDKLTGGGGYPSNLEYPFPQILPADDTAASRIIGRPKAAQTRPNLNSPTVVINRSRSVVATVSVQVNGDPGLKEVQVVFVPIDTATDTVVGKATTRRLYYEATTLTENPAVPGQYKGDLVLGNAGQFQVGAFGDNTSGFRSEFRIAEIVVTTTVPVPQLQGLRMVSIPLAVTSETDLGNLLGVATDKLKAARYDITAQQPYIFYPNQGAQPPIGKFGSQSIGQPLGVAWWMLLDQATQPTNVAGLPTKTGTAVRLALKQGWNMIGTPSGQAVPWDLDALHVALGGEEKTLRLGRDWVEDFAWRWVQDPTNVRSGQYRLVYDGTLPNVLHELAAWDGAWIKAKKDCELIIPPPAVTKERKTGVTGRDKKTASWSFPLRAQLGADAKEVLMGVVETGRGIVIHAPPTPPTGEEAVRLGIANGIDVVSVDLREQGTLKQVWDLVVERLDQVNRAATSSEPVTLTWSDLHAVPKNLSLTLVDTVTGTRRYMRTASSYIYQSTVQESSRRFQVVVEKGNNSRLQVHGLRVESTRGPGLLISFTLTKAVQTTMFVRSLTGRVVRHVEILKSRAAGTNIANWDGCDKNGRRMPVGHYLIEVQAMDEEGRQTRAVVTTGVHN